MRPLGKIHWLGFLLLMCAGICFSQPPAKTIPDAAKMKFFKASSESQAAFAEAQRAEQQAKLRNDAFQAAVKELQAICGKDELQLDKSGDPVCVAKPAPPKEIPKP
jgi:hypothetical protein